MMKDVCFNPSEVESFYHNFVRFKNLRIVLYGIGRYTASLVPALRHEFKFVGLMDKNSENIGRTLHGLPIISLETAEEQADLIIINTAPIYWNVIYRRIMNSSIPIYFCNGVLASDEGDSRVEENSYWEFSAEKLYEMVEDYDVVTFDIFDTLIMRTLLLPQDVFQLLEIKAQKEWSNSIRFAEIRTEIHQRSNDELLTFDQIYDEVQDKLNLSNERRKWLQEQEILIEEEVCIPRTNMIEICNRISKYKEVHIISDMYLPNDVIKSLLLKYGVGGNIPIWISAEKGANKKSGALWKLFTKEMGNKKIIHFGDNQQCDINMAKKYGVQGIYIMSALKIWENSSIGAFLSEVTNLSESIFAGYISSRLFADPFCLNKTKGKVILSDYKNLGYVLYGGVIFCFIIWLIEQSKKNGINRLFFMARDGYWLYEDFAFIKSIIKAYGERVRVPDTVYLPVSRSMVLAACVDLEEGWDNIISYPYTGTFAEYVTVRMHMELPKSDPHYHEFIGLPAGKDVVKEWLELYKEQILKNLHKEKKNYVHYLNKLNISKNDGMVDLWYNGNNQYYLSKILKKKLTGFYFAANLDPSNQCTKNNRLIPCFQDTDDLLAGQSNLLKMAQFVEAFLTAPYGMILAVDENEKFICAPKMGNQKHWESRIEINKGVQEFIKDFTKFGIYPLKPAFIDRFWGEVYQEKISFLQDIKRGFFCDNLLIKQQEMEVFD